MSKSSSFLEGMSMVFAALPIFIVLVLVAWGATTILDWSDGETEKGEWSCNREIKGHEELYCKKVCIYNCNNANYYYGQVTEFEYQVFNRTVDTINLEKSNLAKANRAKKMKENIECYNEGEDHVETYDLIADHNYTCAKIQYINDNFILGSEKKDGGYIQGSWRQSGLFSSGRGSITGELKAWVSTRVSATGLLPETISYHLDCNNETLDIYHQECNWDHWDGKSACKDLRDDTKKIDYYTEAELVMYYVDNCIEE